MRMIQPGLWVYREHLVMQVAPDTFTVYWQGQHGWELWDHFSTLKQVRGAIECVAPRTERRKIALVASGG